MFGRPIIFPYCRRGENYYEHSLITNYGNFWSEEHIETSAFAPAFDGAAALCILDNRRRGEPDQSKRNFRAAACPDPVQAMAGSPLRQRRDGGALWRLEQARSIPGDDEVEPGLV
jgi:hypothetical protein